MAKTSIASVAVNATNSGGTTLAAAATNTIHELIGLSISSNAAVSVKFQSNSNDITGPWNMAAGTPLTIPQLAQNVMSGITPICSTAVAGNEPLKINLSVNASVGGVAIVRSMTFP